MNVGDKLDLKIKIKSGKYGIIKIKDKWIYVAGVAEGDEVQVEITKITRIINYAKIIKRIKLKPLDKEEFLTNA